jgi:glycosyltransferase involved in cell wall biosynthesis
MVPAGAAETSRREPARVGINVLYLVPEQVGGTEIYARRLVAALAAHRPDTEWVVFCGAEAGAVLPDPEWPGNVRVAASKVRCANKPLRVGFELARLPSLVAREGCELLHSLGTTAPLHGDFVRVTTVHDLIYDLFSGSFPTAARLGLKAVVPLAARRSTRVQVSSTATRDEIVERLRVPAARVDVVPLGRGMREIDPAQPPAQVRARLGIEGRPLLLTVAAGLPHKNLDRLLQAAAVARARPALVLAGHPGRASDRLRGLAEELGITDRVRFTGWIEDAQLEALYRAADGFVYPSLHEGFGMPVLEAMHRGVPVACARATSLPEVAGDAALLFDPLSVDAIAAAIDRLLDDRVAAAELVSKGRARAAEFSWARTAEAAWESYLTAMRAV